MPVQGPQWTEFLSCHVCFKVFDDNFHLPISLGCSHTVCKSCLLKLQQRKCPFDQSSITRDVEELPVNNALLQLVDDVVLDKNFDVSCLSDNAQYYVSATKCIEDLALMLKPLSSDAVLLKSDLDEDGSKKTSNACQLNCVLSRPMQRKLVTLINCQLLEEEGRARIMRAARSLGERTVTELILQHQNPQQLSANLWAAVRARGCQFLGPAMQEEVLSLILLALEDGSALSRKVLVLFVVQRLEPQYPHASKTAIGHVVQLLYRASCFKVTKRDEESSLMQLKEEFRTNEMLRREHDSQIVEIALEAGLRISPEQWSSLLYGDAHHKSHMQSIIDKLQTPQSFNQSVSELMIALERTGDPCNLQRLRPHLEFLASVDPSPEMPAPSWENLDAVMKAVKTVVRDLFDFLGSFSNKKHELLPLQNARYKTSMCRDLAQKGVCPRTSSCTFAHSQEEIDKYRLRNKKLGAKIISTPTSAALTPKEKVELAEVNKTMDKKLNENYTTNYISSEQEYSMEDGDLSDKLHMTKVNDNDLSSCVQVVTPHSSPSAKLQDSVPSVHSRSMISQQTPVKEVYTGSSPNSVSSSNIVSNPNTVSSSVPAFSTSIVSSARPPYEIIPPAGGYQSICPPFRPAVPPPNYVPQYSPGNTYPYGPPEVMSYTCSANYYNPSYMGYEQQTVSVPADQWSQRQYYTQVVPSVSGGNSFDTAIITPGSGQSGNEQQDFNQVRKTLTDLHSRRTEILTKLQQNAQHGKSACDPPKYKPLYPASSYASTCHARQQQDMRPRHYTEREFVFIDPRTEQQKNLSTTLQERSIVHSVPPPMNVYSSVSSLPGVLHSTYLITAVSDTVDVVKTSALEKSGCPSYLSSSASYVPWSVEESSSIGVDGHTGSGGTSIHSTNLPWLKISHQDGTEIQTDIVKRSYQDLDSFIPFCPTVVSRFGPISRLARTAKFKMTDPVHVTADESMGKMIPVMSIELPKSSSAPAPSRYTSEEILANDVYPMIPGHFSSDDIILRKHTSIAPTSEGHQTWKYCIQPISHNYIDEECKSGNNSNTDEQLAYELQAIELKLSLGLPSTLEGHESQKNELQKQLEQLDQQFAQQFLMEEIDAQLLGIIQPRNT